MSRGWLIMALALLIVGCDSGVMQPEGDGESNTKTVIALTWGGPDGLDLSAIVAVHLLDGTPVQRGADLADETEVEVRDAQNRVKVVTWGQIKKHFESSGG